MCRAKVSKRKIAFVVSSLNYGGVEKYVVGLANGIDKTKYETFIISFKKDGPLVATIGKNVKICQFDKKEGNSISLIIKLWAFLKKNRIDIVQSNNWSTFFETVVAARLAGIPKLLHTQHGLEQNEFTIETKAKRKFRNIIRRILCIFCRRIIVVSKATQKFVKMDWGVQDNKIKLIYNGVKRKSNRDRLKYPIKYNSINGIPDNMTIIGSVGRLMKVKNYSCLLRAFEKIEKKYHNVFLMLVGDGPERDNLRSLARELGIEYNFKLMGNRDDVQDLLHLMDIFVLPSFSEGISLALLEAMAESLAVVATDVGGNPEIICNYHNGLLVPSDDPDQMAAAIGLLIKDRALNKKICFEAKSSSLTLFSYQRMLTKYEELYYEI